jgi:hypothetical protein
MIADVERVSSFKIAPDREKVADHILSSLDRSISGVRLCGDAPVPKTIGRVHGVALTPAAPRLTMVDNRQFES